jgi:uncharacterized protein YjcR
MEEFKVIPKDVVVNLEISGEYMIRIQQLLEYFIKEYGNEKFVAFAKKVIDNQAAPENAIEQHIVTLSALLTQFEKIAQEQNLVKVLTKEEFAKLNGN